MMQRSNVFFAVVIVLAAIRILAHSYLDRFVDGDGVERELAGGTANAVGAK
jgi:hypothetical protein